MAKDPLPFSAGSKTTDAFSFQAELPHAQRIAERQAARMVVEISKETVAGFRALIRRAIREGIPPREAARTIIGMLQADGTVKGGILGLTTKQNMAALNYQAGLYDLGLSQARVDVLMARYAKKKLRLRAFTVAATETMDALNGGIEESWKQAQKKGLLGKDATKAWLNSGLQNMCAVCASMGGKTAPVGKPFEGARGPTAHPRCHCSVGIRDPGSGRAEE